MTDLAAEAALVAEALGGEVLRTYSGCATIKFDGQGQRPLRFDSRTLEWPVLVYACRRLRGAEQERDEWKAAAEYHYSDVLTLMGHKPKPPARETGPSRCMGTSPGDHVTGGYAVDRDESRTWQADALRRAERSF